MLRVIVPEVPLCVEARCTHYDWTATSGTQPALYLMCQATYWLQELYGRCILFVTLRAQVASKLMNGYIVIY